VPSPDLTPVRPGLDLTPVQLAAADAVRLVGARGETFATAESLTGGLVAATVVEIPGVSAVFRGGLIVYATDLKHALAGVSEELLAERGPVDPDVALALAAGARRRCAADWGLATTGVAGPGPQDGRPAGMVFVAVDGPAGGVVRELQLAGNRPFIRSESVTRVLRLFADQLRAAPVRA
jgi:nicotinamide-nucleotide amidase